MKLEPYTKRVLRVEKVVRHYFNHHERWWVVTDGDFLAWQRSWTTVRATSALGQDKGWLLVLPDTPADAVVAEGHEAWFGAAQRACDSALERHTVFPAAEDERSCYVGHPGITVIVTKRGGKAFLVTCWREAPVRRVSRRTIDAADENAVSKAERKSGYFDRAAVRRQQRRASYLRGTYSDRRG